MTSRASALVLFVLGCSIPAGAAVPNLAETVERFESLRLAPNGNAVTDLAIEIGHMKLSLKSGSVSFVRAGEQTVGVFLQGSGTMEYRSEDRVEFPILVFNVKKNTGLDLERVEKSLAIRDRFERALLLIAGRPLPEISGSPGSASPEVFARHLEKFRRANFPHVSHLFAQQIVEAPASPLAVAEIDGGKEALVYTLDGVQAQSESLVALHKSESDDLDLRKLLFPAVLSDQPIGRDRRDPLAPLYYLTAVDLALTASGGKDASISVTETVRAQGARRQILRFNFYNTSYGEGARVHHLRSVSDASGNALPFDHRGDEVAVELKAPLEPDQETKIRFEINGNFLVRPGGDNFWELGLGGGAWFPQPDLAGQFYTWHSLIRVKKPFLPFSSGQTIRRWSEGDENIVETKTETPVQFPAVLAGKYESREETREGITIRVATYAMKDERAMKQLTDLAFGIISYYQRFLGPFPFPEYNILEINTWGFGQAPPGILFITQEAFTPLMGETNQFFSQGINERFAHEIAHQYWGHVVKMPGLEEQWLTESFAEYCAALFLKSFKGQSSYDKLMTHWKSNAEISKGVSPIPLANRIYVSGDPIGTFATRSALIYDKGALLLAAIHRDLGDQMFLSALKSYQKSFRWKFGSTKTFEGLIEWLTKKDYAAFFDSNYWGTGIPQ